MQALILWHDFWGRSTTDRFELMLDLEIMYQRLNLRQAWQVQIPLEILGTD